MNGAPMSPDSREAIRAAQKAHRGVFVSPITAWEIGTLLRKNRIRIASALLPGDPPRDPADRIIAATARAFGFTVITRDGALIPYAAAGHIQVVTC